MDRYAEVWKYRLSFEESRREPFAPLQCQIKKIGAGSFGTAFLCREKSSGETVVIKKVDITGMKSEERRVRRGLFGGSDRVHTLRGKRQVAQREGAILAHLKHPCILRHIETFEDGDYLCIVTEFCEVGDLGALQERRVGKLLPEAQVGDWFVQLCLGLLYSEGVCGGATVACLA